MKSKVIIVLLIATTTIFSSCNERVKNEVEHIKSNKKSIGSIVSKLDPKANLIYQDKKNNYWFGSKEKGVYKYDGETITLFNSKDGLISHNILSIQEDKHGNLFFDTLEGINKYDGYKITTLKVEDKESSKKNWKLHADDLWFRMGWDKRGPHRFDGKKLYYLEFPKNEMEDEFYAKYPEVSFNPYGVYCIFKDSKGHMWFGTSSLGIYHYDGEKISWMYEHQLTETPQGGSFGIRSIAEDLEGYFWFCNTDYKYKILPARKEENQLYKLNYNREIGIENKIGETEYFLSMVSDEKGNIWMQSYDNGIWQNTGKELIHYPVKDGKKDILLSSIYIDNTGELWVATQNNGAYKYKSGAFKKFKIE